MWASKNCCPFLFSARNITWTPKNKKPDKLKDALKEVEVRWTGLSFSCSLSVQSKEERRIPAICALVITGVVVRPQVREVQMGLKKSSAGTYKQNLA